MGTATRQPAHGHVTYTQTHTQCHNMPGRSEAGSTHMRTKCGAPGPPLPPAPPPGCEIPRSLLSFKSCHCREKRRWIWQREREEREKATPLLLAGVLVFLKTFQGESELCAPEVRPPFLLARERLPLLGLPPPPPDEDIRCLFCLRPAGSLGPGAGAVRSWFWRRTSTARRFSSSGDRASPLMDRRCCEVPAPTGCHGDVGGERALRTRKQN